MDKKIPIYFDNVIIASPLTQVSESNPNLGRLKVGVFTKYANRNGSYITEAVADALIAGAIDGSTPVVGFFDPETKSWASHTGPTLANGYGYVESFDGWQPLQDTDGITRDYAVFNVILFTKYFDEAGLIIGQNQSMELDEKTIDGTWAEIEGNEVFVYTRASIKGLCVIGAHEPCFSVSSFFEKQEDAYINQYEKFSSLLAEAKKQVEEAKIGGEKTMDEFNNQETVVEEETPQAEETSVDVAEENNEEVVVVEEEPVVEETNEPTEYELLQEKLNELQSNYEIALNRIQELEGFQAELETLRTENKELQTSIATYEAQIEEIELNRKNNLIEKYEKILNEAEEISTIKSQVKDYSYDALESKLAILFANKQLTGNVEQKKVVLPEPQESQFALLIKKYRKN